MDWAGQVILGVDQIYWTEQSENAIEKNNLSGWYEQQKSDIKKLVAIIRNPDLSKCKRGIIGALIITNNNFIAILTESLKRIL